MSSKKAELIIFDWDDTIVDTGKLITSALKETLKQYAPNSELKYFELYKQGLSSKKIFPEIFGDNIEEALAHYLEEYKKLQNNITFLENSKEVIKELHNREIKLAILSNKLNGFLQDEVSALNMENYFIEIIGSGLFPEDKPSAIAVQHLLKKYQIDKQNSYIVGDSEVDILCASNSNINSIHYNPENIAIEAKPDFTIEKINQLNEFFSLQTTL